MSRASKPIMQIQDGEWFRESDGTIECCGCGLVHAIAYKLEDGDLYVKMTQDPRDTKRARVARARAGQWP